MHLLPLAICAVAAIGAGEPVLVDFSASWCGPCREMEPVVARLEQEGYRVKRVDVERERELAAQHGVNAIPCFVLLIDGREAGRVVGKASYAELVALYPPRPIPEATPERRSLLDATLPNRQGPANAGIPANPALASAAPAAVRPVAHTPAPPRPAAAANPAPAAMPPAAGLRNLRKSEPAKAAPAQINAATLSPSDPIAVCFAASVRLTMDDAGGRSFGSGTVIDAMDKEALVLTCGHIFRENKGQGTISVDFVGEAGLKGLKARVIGYDLNSDVALITVETPRRVTAAKLAPAGFALAVGDKVVSIGCPRGGEPTVEPSKVNSLNKYLGPSNIQVAGLPIQGRSGGGLFTADGRLVGVCNAADPADNEGLYAGLESVHTALKASGLEGLIPAGAPAPSPASLAAAPKPAAAPIVDPRAAPASPSARPVANVPAAAAGANAANLSADEQAVLSQIASQGEHAEVVCVIRSLSDPRAKSEIIVLDRASPHFLRQLASEQNVQDARTLTDAKSNGQTTPASPSAVERNDEPRKSDSWTPVWKAPPAPKK